MFGLREGMSECVSVNVGVHACVSVTGTTKSSSSPVWFARARAPGTAGGKVGIWVSGHKQLQDSDPCFEALMLISANAIFPVKCI